MDHINSIQIYLNSRYANENVGGNIANSVYYLPVIDVPDGHHIYLSLQSATIPYSFYSISELDNTLTFGLSSAPSPTTVTIPVGNYNITQLLAVLTGLMTGFTLSFSSITSKLTITQNSLAQFVIYTGTFNHVIGFSKTTNTTSVLGILQSRDCVNLNAIRALNVEVNFPTYNVNVAQALNQNILASIPVYVAPYSIITYQNLNNFRTNLYVNKFDQIQIRILDNENRLINLNGIQYQMTLQLDCVKFIE